MEPSFVGIGHIQLFDSCRFITFHDLPITGNIKPRTAYHWRAALICLFFFFDGLVFRIRPIPLGKSRTFNQLTMKNIFIDRHAKTF